MQGVLRRSGSIAPFRRFWRTWARPPSRRNPAGGLLGDPKADSPAGPSATRLLRVAPEPTKTVIAKGFAMEIKPIAKSLVVKTQAKVCLRQSGGIRSAYLDSRSSYHLAPS